MPSSAPDIAVLQWWGGGYLQKKKKKIPGHNYGKERRSVSEIELCFFPLTTEYYANAKKILLTYYIRPKGLICNMMMFSLSSPGLPKRTYAACVWI